MPIHDLRCDRCGRIDQDVALRGTRRCPSCGRKMTIDFSRWRTVNTDIWGHPQYIASMPGEGPRGDGTFSRSELKAWMRTNGMREAGDRVGGARNEEHLHLGKSYSYKGQGKRCDNPLAKRPMRGYSPLAKRP
jgi:hypothetical protein